MKFPNLNKLKALLAKAQSSPQGLMVFGCLILVLLTYLISKHQEKKVVTYQSSVSDFKSSKTVSRNNELYRRKDKIYVNKVKELEEKLLEVTNKITDYEGKLEALSKKEEERTKRFEKKLETSPIFKQELSGAVRDFDKKPKAVQLVEEEEKAKKKTERKRLRSSSIINFPVKNKAKPSELGVRLPSGSFVKGKLLTGIEAPEGKTLPVLMQADYAFVGPNKSRVDLSGCFIIAKSTGNLSIERVEMQTTKISCVAKSGKMFERPLNGYVADGKDNSFAVMGIVNSKRDRVASMAFLSSVVDGIGKALSKAQTKTTTNQTGSSSEVTGSKVGYVAGSAASQAASTVTNWYLQHAQGLLPTINVGSGQEVWVIMQESVSLPNWYFEKLKPSSELAPFLSNIIH